MPSAKILDVSAGNIVLSISHDNTKELNVFFKIIENKDIEIPDI